MKRLSIMRVGSFLLAMVLAVSVFVMVPTKANAASAGTMVSNAVNVTLGQTYFKAWTKDTDHLNHYVKFTIPQQGIVTITATKPFDSEGEYGRIYFVIYDSNLEPIMSNDSRGSVDNVKDSYEVYTGLAAGTYYITMKPAFYVQSGLIETYYSVKFTANEYVEIENNDDAYGATPLTMGQWTVGFFGSDGYSGDAEENDYYKFPIQAGRTYKVSMKNFRAFDTTSTILDVLLPGGDDTSLGYSMGSNVDSNGYNYATFKAKTSGTAYLRFYNFNGQQYRFEIKVTDGTFLQYKNQWVKLDGEYYYVDAYGEAVTEEWRLSGSTWFYLGEDGKMARNAWCPDGAVWRYVDGNGWIVKNKWIQKGSEWCYVDGNGARVTKQWKKISNQWYYFDSDGYMAANEWAKDGSYWCYMNADGLMTKNKWIKDGGQWYYLESTGYMATNKWLKDAGKWCYVDKHGCMVANKWIHDGAGWCYLGADGYMVYNKWVKDSMGWCYVGSNGYMVSNKWINDGTGWCYMGADGYMVSNKWVKDSMGWCYLGADGYMVTNDWAKDSSGWRYMGADGYMVKNKWIHDGTGWCFIGSNGYMAANKWVSDGTGWCYLGADGYMCTNQWIKGAYTLSYVDANGYALIGTHYIDGVKYTFDANGNLVG